MIAVDTNVIVRYLVADQPDQFERATALIENQSVFICSTVVLEVEWVLRSIYRLDRSSILRALRSFVRLPMISIEAPSLVSQALDWAEQGMDFADALHLASAASCEAFASFDRSLDRTARKVGAMKVRAP